MTLAVGVAVPEGVSDLLEGRGDPGEFHDQAAHAGPSSTSMVPWFQGTSGGAGRTSPLMMMVRPVPAHRQHVLYLYSPDCQPRTLPLPAHVRHL